MDTSEILLPTARAPQLDSDGLAAAVRRALPDIGDGDLWWDCGDLNVRVPLEKLHTSLAALRDADGLQMRFLVSLTAVHWPEREMEFELVYHLRSLSLNLFFVLKSDVAMAVSVPTASDLFLTADWQERECYDMFGIEFADHPDLRRILMPQPYPWFPLRKGFPLEGPDFPVDGYQTDALGKVEGDDFWRDSP